MAGPTIDLSKLSVADFGAESRVYDEKSTCLYAIAVGAQRPPATSVRR